MNRKSTSLRWAYLVLGVLALLFAGVIYAWSILKTPLAEAFGWSASALTLNFTLTMCFFCLGGFVGGLLSKRLGGRLCLLLAAVLSGLGFYLSSRLSGAVLMLYLGYGILAGFGIGIAYNVIISTVSAWFPDKKGLCSGALMMGFGASALVIGKLASALIDGPGWRVAYLTIGIALTAVLAVTALLLRLPGADTALPAAQKKSAAGEEAFEQKDYTTAEMLRRRSFWFAFLGLVCLAAVGNTVISFARDLALSVGAQAALATTLVGVLSICNGLGRIVIGALFDRLGRKRTMLLANVLTILAAGVTLLAVLTKSLPLCVVGLCLTGFSYGAASAGTRAMTSSSSPGISLKSEGISYCAAARIPMVYANFARGGPGVGSIQPAQQDYFQATKASGNGGFRMPVLAPATVQEAVDLTVLAFDWADRDRTPVLLLADGVIGTMMEPVALPTPKTDEEIAAIKASKRAWACVGHPLDYAHRAWIQPGQWSTVVMQQYNEDAAAMYESWQKEAMWSSPMTTSARLWAT